MKGSVLLPLAVLSFCIAPALNAPVSAKIAEDVNIPAIYKTFQAPIHSVRCTTKQARDLFKKERKMATQYDGSSYSEMFKNKCEKQFSNQGTEQRFVYAMKIFQKLVGLTQDIQLSESRLHEGDETMFVRDFRAIEYKIREFVEDKMRSASSDIIKDEKLRTTIPSYSVGGLIDESLTEASKENAETVNARNYEKMHQIEQCFHEFYRNIVVPQAGEASYEC